MLNVIFDYRSHLEIAIMLYYTVKGFNVGFYATSTSSDGPALVPNKRPFALVASILQSYDKSAVTSDNSHDLPT